MGAAQCRTPGRHLCDHSPAHAKGTASQIYVRSRLELGCKLEIKESMVITLDIGHGLMMKILPKAVFNNCYCYVSFNYQQVEPCQINYGTAKKHMPVQ